MKTRSDLLLSASELLGYDEDQSPPAHLPNYFGHLEQHFSELDAIAFQARVSDPKPGRRDTTPDQLRDAKKFVRDLERLHGRKLKRLGSFRERVSGSDFSKRGRSELVAAGEVVNQHPNAAIVSVDVSRYVRNKDYQKPPTVDDCKAIKRLVKNALMLTIGSPEKHEHRSRSVKRKLAKVKASGRKLGRPKTKETLKLEAQKLFAQGIKPPTVSKMLKIPIRTAYNWPSVR